MKSQKTLTTKFDIEKNPIHENANNVVEKNLSNESESESSPNLSSSSKTDDASDKSASDSGTVEDIDYHNQLRSSRSSSSMLFLNFLITIS